MTMKETEKLFQSSTRGDPGAARLGNFINYYQFNPPSERLSLLFPHKLFSQLEMTVTGASTLNVLDIGCNSGVSKRFQI